MSALDAVAHELVRLVRRMKDLHGTAVRASGLDLELAAFVTLSRLVDEGPQRPSSLAAALQVDLSTVSRQVAALERLGHVSRERDPADSRAQLVAATDSGQAAVARLREARLGLMAERLQGWSESDLELLAQLLHRFTDDFTDDLTGGTGEAPLATTRARA